MADHLEHQDVHLVRRLLSGDEEAFEEFYNSHAPKLFRFVLIRLNYDEDSAEEVVQSALCKAISKLRTYRGEASLFTWLCTFCRHAISAYVKRNRGLSVEWKEDSPEIRAALESVSAFEPQDQSIRKREVVRLVQNILDYLPDKYGDVLEWKYVYGLSVAEISVRLQMNYKATESLLTRARKAFREAFVSVYGEWKLQESMNS